MGRVTEVPNLTPEQTMGLFRAVLGNAEALTEEAQLLLAANHYPRAYALGHLAHEELAKCYGLLNIWAVQIRASGAPPWELFWKRWRNHEFKVQLALAGDLIRQWVGQQSAGPPVQVDQLLPPDIGSLVRGLYLGIESALPQHAELSRLRIDATYVDFRAERVVLPTEAITQKMSADMVEAAKVNCQFMSLVLATGFDRLQEIVRHPAMADIEEAWKRAADPA